MKLTAANPESKLYAYEAGKRALQSTLWEMGYNAELWIVTMGIL